MTEANKHITPSMRKTCEGCGVTGVKTYRGRCGSCNKAARDARRLESMALLPRCSVTGCINKVMSSGLSLCGKHYHRIYRSRKAKPNAPTASMSVVCEGCGNVGGKTVKALCKDCGAKSKRIRDALSMRRLKGREHLPPRLVDKRPDRTLTCRECGEEHSYSPHFGAKIYEYQYCSRRCQKRASDRMRTRARRAATMGAHAEVIDYNTVFSRDGWRCGLCGIKTLRSKRGTLHSRAPVLDHIIPLSKGGKHTHQNVQCACHSCNASKGADLVGQLRLFG